MCATDPWDAIERAVLAELYPGHPYGRPIIGYEDDIRRISRADLDRFHRAYYHPGRAVLVVVGGFDSGAREAIARRLGGIAPAADGESMARPPGPPAELQRCELVRGRVDRLLLVLPLPPLDHSDFAALRLIAALLGSGRSSALNERLVEREGLFAYLNY